MSLIRRGNEADLADIAAIQAESPEAAQWRCADYLAYDLRVAESGGRVVGFLVARTVAPDEAELLNVAVASGWRRQGIGGALLFSLMKQKTMDLFLEVRESNDTARRFYQALGFKEVSTRPQYYKQPLEAAIVMKFHSC